MALDLSRPSRRMASSNSKRVPWSFPRITNSDGTIAVPGRRVLEPVRQTIAWRRHGSESQDGPGHHVRLVGPPISRRPVKAALRTYYFGQPLLAQRANLVRVLPTGFLRFYGLMAHSDRAWPHTRPGQWAVAAARCPRGPSRRGPSATARQREPRPRPGRRDRFPGPARSDRGDAAGPRPALAWPGWRPSFARRDVPERSARRRGSRPRHQQSAHYDGCPKLAPSVVWQEPDFHVRSNWGKFEGPENNGWLAVCQGEVWESRESSSLASLGLQRRFDE